MYAHVARTMRARRAQQHLPRRTPRRAHTHHHRLPCQVEIVKPRIPVISNVDAKTHSDPEVIKQILAKQVHAARTVHHCAHHYARASTRRCPHVPVTTREPT